MSESDDLLQRGIAAARAGRRDEARALLMQVVEADERSEQAWLWLAGVVDDPQDIRVCLANVLDLNPGNAQAQQGLAWVNARYGPPPDPEPAPALPEPEVAPDPPAATAPPYTGPTTRLDPQLDLAAATVSFAPPPQMPPAALAALAAEPAPAAGAAEQPCPYCGTPTPLSQDHCRQCRNSLTMRAAPPARRSTSLTILGWLWVISGVPAMLIGLLLVALAVLLPRAPRATAAASAANAAAFAVAIAVFLVGLFYIVIGRSLLGRRRWAYLLVAFFTLLGLIGIPCSLIQSATMMRDLPATLATQGLPARAITTGMTFVWVALFVSFAIQLLYILLVFLSYRDFFGPRVRLSSEIEPTGHMEHYNNGVAYKNRGMWYLATKEWEAAALRAPRDLGYLHALGLAYAQLKKLYPQAAPYHQSFRNLLASRKADLFAIAPELERLNLF